MQNVSNLEKIFIKRTANIYRHQCERFTEKRNKRGRVTQVGREIPYSLAEFREWAKAQFPETRTWVTRCGYCNAILTLEACCSDHRTPVSRGGDLGLDNQILCCDPCNRIKGKLTAKEYSALRQGLETFPETARADIYARLKTGAGFVRLRFMGKAVNS